MIEPGGIYWADFRDQGRHPVIVVSRKSLNNGDSVLAVICTSAKFAVRCNLPNCVPFRAGECGFERDCVAQCENLLTIRKDILETETGRIGILNEIGFREVIRAIGYVVDADCEPI